MAQWHKIYALGLRAHYRYTLNYFEKKNLLNKKDNLSVEGRI